MEGTWHLCGSTGLVGLLGPLEDTLNWCMDLGLVGGLDFGFTCGGSIKGKLKVENKNSQILLVKPNYFLN